MQGQRTYFPVFSRFLIAHMRCLSHAIWGLCWSALCKHTLACPQKEYTKLCANLDNFHHHLHPCRCLLSIHPQQITQCSRHNVFSLRNSQCLCDVCCICWLSQEDFPKSVVILFAQENYPPSRGRTKDDGLAKIG